VTRVIAWTPFSGDSPKASKSAFPWTRPPGRGRGLALWKAMIVLVDALRDDPEDAIATKGVIAGVPSDNVLA
jgi:hypothetical protein